VTLNSSPNLGLSKDSKKIHEIKIGFSIVKAKIQFSYQKNLNH
jgi:hypothetical protein